MATNPAWLYPLFAILALLLLWGIYRFIRGRENRFKNTLKDISFERLEALVIPNGDEGEIQIDYLLLTAQGLLILDIKEAVGTVFGSDKMQDWTVIGEDRRYTFSNPQPALYDRIAAVRAIVRQVPVAGRVLFLGGAEFTKGIPTMVTTLDDLRAEFGEQDKKAARFKIESFMPHWEQISARAAGGTR